MPAKSFAAKFLEICACLHVTTMMTMLNFACFYLAVKLLFSPYWYLLLLYLIWWFYDRNTPYQSGRPTRFIRNLFLWKYLASYFPIKLHKTADLDPSKNCLFAFHPHGLFVFGGFANFATNANGFDSMFPGLTVHFAVLNGQFNFPFYREYIISGGFCSANSESIDWKLSKNGPGHSVWLAVGGAAEVSLGCDRRTYSLKLLNRKGFIRKVLKNGASLVPVFSFNENKIYGISLPKKELKTYYIQYYIQRFIKFVTGMELPVDIHGAPWCHLLVPKQRPINTVIGAPLDFAELKSQASYLKGQDLPEELVDKCHQVYMEALRQLYDENKGRFGDENTPLIFV